MIDRVTPWLDDGDVQLYLGDAIDVLRELPAETVQTVVTSPPYWGLRDYGAAGQLGLERTPESYVDNLVVLFREVARVMRPDGTLWLNLGDTYAAKARGSDEGWTRSRLTNPGTVQKAQSASLRRTGERHRGKDVGLKEKDLAGIPWRVAFALQADGWVLRSDVVWAKPNPMPESVTDRPTKAHEMVFLFAKGKWVGPERGRFAHISEEDARWLALLFDTEGNIVIKRAEREGRLQFGAQMAFANCSRRLLEQAQAIVGAGSLHTRSGRNAPVHYWQMTGQQARDLLHRIYPHLIVKQRQARVAIYMQDVVAEPKRRPGGYRTAEHEAFLTRCWETVKALNQFGEPDLSWVPEPRYGRWTSQPYFYDADAIREPHHPDGRTVTGRTSANGTHGNHRLDQGERRERWPGLGRNRRSVWEIATQPFPEAHFATYPQKLVEPCIMAGTSEHGECSSCGTPWGRVVDEPENVHPGSSHDHTADLVGPGAQRRADGTPAGTIMRERFQAGRERRTTGWQPGCSCDAPARPQTVLDPFSGSGTTALVARRLGRHAIGIELSADYLEIAARRTRQLSLLGGAT